MPAGAVRLIGERWHGALPGSPNKAIEELVASELDAVAATAATPAVADRSAWRRLNPRLFSESDLDILTPLRAAGPFTAIEARPST